MTDRDTADDRTAGSRLLLIAAALACLVLYLPALGGPLFFDDIPNLLDNALVQIDGRQFDDWRSAALSSSAGALDRPVAMWTFALNHVLAGAFTPAVIKTTNLFIHLLCGALIYLIVLRLARAPVLVNGSVRTGVESLALLAAALWLLHPLHVSTVMYGVQRMAQLATLFSLGGILVYLHYRLRWATSGASAGEVAAAALWVLLLTAVATLSKENGVLLPWLVIVIEATLFGGHWAGQRNRALGRAAWCLLVAPLLLLPVLYAGLPDWLLDRYANREFTLEERVLTQFRVLWYYVYWTVFPVVTELGFFHDDIAVSRGLFEPVTTLLAILGWLAVVSLAAALQRAIPLVAFAVFFFLVGHTVESTVLPLEMVFEHRNYLPSVGLLILASQALLALGSRLGAGRYAMPGVLVVVALAIMLGIRSYAWRDATTLARYNVVNHPHSPRANFYYANAVYNQYLATPSTPLYTEQRAALAVTARQYYLAMHELDGRDIAPLVMLYQVDTRHFPRLALEQDWLAKIEALALTRQLQRSDVTALGVLIDHVLSGGPNVDRARVASTIAHLQERRPGSFGLLALRFKLLAGGGVEERETLRALLEAFVERRPGHRKAAALQAQFHARDNLPATYAAVARWLANDRDRLEIGTIRAVFDQ